MNIVQGQSERTLFDCAERQLRVLTAGCEFHWQDTENAVALLRDLSQSWGTRSMACVPRWSGVTDDCSPIEFSLGIEPNAKPELRFVLEAQADPATPQTYFVAAQRLNERLHDRYGAYFDRLRAITDLITPTQSAYFAMLHGVIVRPGRDPHVKVYLNPNAHGQEHAHAVAAEVFVRLGVRSAWESIAEVLDPDDQLQFIALDCTAEPEARIKLYVRHAPSASGFERALRRAVRVIGSDVQRFSDLLFPSGNAGPTRPAMTMYVATRTAVRVDASFAVAVYPSIGSDAVAFERITNLLEYFGLPIAAYVRSVNGLEPHGLSAKRGLHNWISFQHRKHVPRVTIYLAPRMYLQRLGPIGYDPEVVWPTPVGSLVSSA